MFEGEEDILLLPEYEPQANQPIVQSPVLSVLLNVFSKVMVID
jgi:hypothetical protein